MNHISIKIFTDRNLIKIVSQGWDLDRLVKGKIGTLTGRTFSIKLPLETGLNTTISALKGLIEDQEGIPIEKQEIRKGSKKLEDDQTLRHYLVDKDITLLLLASTDDYDKYLFHPSVEESNGMKVKMKPQVTQTLTVDEETAKKMSTNEDWWKSSSMLSGPQNVRRPTTTPTAEAVSTTTPTTSVPSTFTTQSVDTPNPEERRRQMRLAAERRMKATNKL